MRVNSFNRADEKQPSRMTAYHYYTRDRVAAMLLADAEQRRAKSWPLLDEGEILKVNSRLFSGHIGPTFDQDSLLVVNPQKPRKLNPIGEAFRQKYPFVDRILAAFPGKVIVAGGSIFSEFVLQADISIDMDNVSARSCDLDFFFINVTKEEVEAVIKFAWELVAGPQANVMSSTCIDRCQNTTTIYYGDMDMDMQNLTSWGWEEDGGKWQFIHRSYPDPAAVIAGFDLGPGMVFYDGADFYATQLGAWSIATQTILLDPSRRSTSYEYRIAKYLSTKQCQLVICNGSTTGLYKHLDSEVTRSKTVTRYICPVKGLKIDGQFVPHGRYTDLDQELLAEIDREDEAKPEKESIGIYDFKFGDRPESDDEEDNDEEGSPRRSSAEIMNMMERLGLRLPQMSKPFSINGVYIDPDDNTQNAQLLAMERKNYLKRETEWKNRFTVCAGIRKTSDYDGGQFNEFSLREANAIFAARGKIDCITWRSRDIEEILDDPDPSFRIGQKVYYKPLPRYTDINMSTGETQEFDPDANIREYRYLDCLHRWFSKEKVAQIVAGPVESGGRVPINSKVFREMCFELNQTIMTNMFLARKKAEEGITLITENPGRQWTASNNPVYGDVRDYYHPELLKDGGPLQIGVSNDVYCLLYCAWKRPDCGGEATWRLIPRDIFRMIIYYSWKAIAADGQRLFLGL